VLYAAVGLNGLKRWTEVSPLRVMANALALLSMKRLLWQVSREVLVIAVRGAVGGMCVRRGKRCARRVEKEKESALLRC
jgi:hypothetical protein